MGQGSAAEGIARGLNLLTSLGMPRFHKLKLLRPLVIRCAFVLMGAGLMTSCTWKSTVQPSVLVILVENLGFGAFPCGDEQAGERAGFQAFCEESVRFTHAYTPSTMSQATIASILTAQYPSEHGVRHNGAQGLSAKAKTVSELALSRGFHTAFFSGGPPIWRRSGLHQGFEVFDDGFQVSLERLYRPARDMVRAFLNWQEADAGRGRFFSFLFLSDLQFLDAPTTNDLGEERESSYLSQVEELGEGLGALVKEMKRRKVWDSTDIYLVGLNGFARDERVGEPVGANLFSETTRTTLMIKPARKMRDGAFNWKIDLNVSLVDVGATLFEMFDPKFKSPSKFDVVSLKSALKGPQPTWSADRSIVSETAWPAWRDIGNVRSAVRTGPYLYLFGFPEQMFYTLSDNLETSPLARADEHVEILKNTLAGFLQEQGYDRWIASDRIGLEKAILGAVLWRNRFPDKETLGHLRDLTKRYPRDEQLAGWRAIWAIRRNDWRELKTVAGKKNQRPAWAYVAARNLGEKAEFPDDPCFTFLNQPKGTRALSKDCESEGVVDLVRWWDDSLPERIRTRAMESFLREENQRALAIKVAEQNQVTGMKWSTAEEKMAAPHVIDLLLALPEMKRYLTTVRARGATNLRGP